MKDLSKEVKSIKTNDKDTQILITKLADELNKKMKDINKEDEDDKKIYNDIMKQTEEIMKNIWDRLFGLSCDFNIDSSLFDAEKIVEGMIGQTEYMTCLDQILTGTCLLDLDVQ